MSNLKVTTADLAQALQKKAKITEDEAKKFVNAYFNLIAEGIRAEDNFSIHKFGTFKKQLKKGRTGRNPSTGETIEIPSRYNVTFNAVSSVAKRVNKPYEKLKAKVIEEPVVVEKEKPATPKEKVVVQEKPVVVQEKITKKSPDAKSIQKVVVPEKVLPEEESIPEIETPIAFVEKPIKFVEKPTIQKKAEIIKVERKDVNKEVAQNVPQTERKVETQKSATTNSDVTNETSVTQTSNVANEIPVTNEIPITKDAAAASEPKVIREIIR